MRHHLINLFLFLPILTFAQLTGFWQTDTGGCYQIRQDGNEIWWAGETSGSERATNVFHGTIAGNMLTGQWCDLPSNNNQQCEQTLALRIESDSRLVKIASSTSYNGNIWTKTPGGCGGWIALHQHQGCTNPQPFCKEGKWIPIRFNTLEQGPVVAVANERTTMTGTLNGLVFNYTYNAGSAGKGQIIFSPDFKTFTGTFEDAAGHRGIWRGERK